MITLDAFGNPVFGGPDTGNCLTVENTAALREFKHKPTAGDMVTTLGDVSQGDGDGGYWFWVDYSLEADDGVNVVKCTDILAGRFYRYFPGSNSSAAVLGFGAGDSRRVYGSVTSSSALLTVPSGGLVSLDVGKSVAVIGAGPAGATLTTTIVAVLSGTTATLADTASTTVSFATVYYGTNDTAAFLTALAATPEGGSLLVRRGRGGGGYFINGTHETSVPMVFEPGACLHVPVPGWTIAGLVRSEDTQIIDVPSSSISEASTSDRVITGQSYASPAWWGAVDDMVEVTDFATTNGSDVVTSAGTTFTSADLGKHLTANKIDPDPPYYGIVTVTGTAQGITGKIIAINSSHSVTLDANANCTGTGMCGNYGTVSNVPFQFAVACVNAAGGGTVQVPRGTYGFVNTGTTFSLELPNKTTFTGYGLTGTTLKMWSNQPSFTRLVSAFDVSDVIVSGMTMDGNAAYQVNPNEQQHLLMIRDDAVRVDVSNCLFQNARGDGVFTFWQGLGDSKPQDVSVVNCRFEGPVRTGIHLQQFKRVRVGGCTFHNMDIWGIKEEPDDPTEFGEDAVITNNIFSNDEYVDQSNTGSGILFAGTSTNPTTGLVVSDNHFQNLGIAVAFGLYSHRWSVTGNTIDGCQGGITSINYSNAYGFVGNTDVVIANNVITNVRDPGGAGVDGSQAPIFVANGSNVIISNNSISGDLNRAGIQLAETNGFTVSGNVIHIGGAPGYLAIFLKRSCRGQIHDNIIRNTNATATYAGFWLEDAYLFGSYDIPMQHVSMYNNQLFGNFTFGITGGVGSPSSKGLCLNPPSVADGTVGTLNNFNFNTLNQVDLYGTIRAPNETKIGTQRISYGTASPASDTATTAWAVGDYRKNTGSKTVTNGAVLDGWVCTVAGTPGTHQETWLPTHPVSFLSKTVAGRNGVGGCTATGAVVGDTVVQVLFVDTGSLADAGSSFESTITVADQVRQISTNNLTGTNFIVLIMHRSS